ncbi:uncharacterized protein LOC108104322 isoform X2 [Drosophila eugracilis]|uniref:uncharacterized protein LOC108104322 isoform X2 n=1 Tax=Drosophila eugracilis TaxID=29029 RepID=UPI001BD9EDDB|nr:uncharacterized protein LOC108104322 isoform X2 [Drosophila eugracilis]
MASTKNELVTMWSTCLLFFSFCFMTCNGHGRLIDPPGRASAWRFGFKTPPDYNDHELYCGGFTRQWKRNGGKCGECGDAWDIPEPRPHEFGGQWGQGLIVRSYEPGSNMTIRVELTASHMGYFEFRLCPNRIAKQSCFDQNLLRIIDGFPSQPISSDLDIRFYPRNGSRIYEIQNLHVTNVFFNGGMLREIIGAYVAMVMKPLDVAHKKNFVRVQIFP